MRGPALLRAWRKGQSPKLTQNQAAALISCTQAAWCLWEAGKKTPNVTHAVRLAELTAGAVPVTSWVVATTPETAA